MFEIRDGSGKVFNYVKRPAAVYDGKASVLYKVGEYEEMKAYFELVQYQYREYGFHSFADEICLMELPHDQDEIDKVFQICDYIGVLHQQIS